MTKSILVIDDDAMNREVMEAFLTSEGFDVILANDGKSGLTQASRGPTLIILDVRLPDISGYDVCATIKQNAETEHIPIMMITGHDEEEYRRRGFDAGADDFLSRPFDGERFISHVNKLIRQ